MTLARRTITIVFCDVVESTTLGESMDPELLRQVITRYFEEMQRILASYDGTVEKFIGDAVMGAFGIPVLHEDDALRAVTAAVDMQGAIEGLNRDLKTQRGLQLQVRIGVNTGEVVTGDPSAAHGFVSGDPVNVAARLQQQSSPGEILIGEQTYQLVRDAIDADDVGALELKGKARPMRAYRVCDVQRGSLGRWRRLDSPLVGRATEMRSLNEAFSLVIEQGSPSLMSVLGHPGTGKTRLTQEFLSEVTGHAHVLKARFLPYGQIGALRPLAESIEDYCAIDEKDSVGEVTRKLAGVVEKDDDRDLVVTRLLALLERTAEAPDIQDLFWAFRRFCEAIGRVRPVILFLDDLHWAESSVLDLVEYMSAFARVPLLVLCTARLSLRDEQRPTWGQGQPTLVLDRLSDDEVKQLCRILTEGCSLPIELENRIVDMAEGNPLYVEELVRALIDAGLMERTESGWQVVGDIADLEIPPSIGALVAARLDRLTSEERTILERASVVGGSFWWKSLNVVLPPELGPQAGRHLHTLMKKELLEADLSLGSDDAFRFKHEVVRRMAYVGLAKELRSELHERVARWMVGLSSGATSEEQIAFHLEQSVRLRRALGTADDHTEEMARKASALLDATGQKALNLSDVATAIGVLRRAVDLLPEDGDRGRLSIDLAGALLESGDLASARDELELVLGRP
ncbi:MAG TPA: adenylate/guanylate cyclase domain-containing protein, partial [Actinomycetota bacterium]|nr:adenylate/guanylate cyclase domain-containing protein [Actinomycetota bacterium]